MSEFRESVCKVRGRRNHRIKGAFRVVDIYRALRKRKRIPGVDEKTFRLIVKTMGDNLKQMILDGYVIKLPLHMGHIQATKKGIVTKFVDGKVVHNRIIDWGSTVSLWEHDVEARDGKTLVYYTDDCKYNVKHYKDFARYRNKFFFTFKMHSDIMRNIYAYAKEHDVTYHKE